MASEEKFDPMKTRIDSYYIPHLPIIAHRARWILRNKSSDDVISAQNAIEGWVESYFETAFEDEVRRLRTRAEEGNSTALGYFHVERRYYGDEWNDFHLDIKEFNENYRDDLEIPTEANTSKVQALDECIGWFDLADEVLGDDEASYFAALALEYVEKSIWFLKHWWSPPEDGGEYDRLMVELHESMRKFMQGKGENPDSLPRPVGVDFKIACEAAIDAMDAVRCAEGYLEQARMRSQFLKKSAEAVSAAAREQQEKHAAEELRKKKERTKRLNEQREAKRKEAMALVLVDWELNGKHFNGPKEAGEHYSKWLTDTSGKRFKYAATTIRDWISERAEELGIKWR
jgi:hypothetical protein